jgi:2-methylfumaryl-CoA isomerase
MGVDMDDAGGRYRAPHAIAAVLEPWIAAKTLGDVKQAFEGSGVLWGAYQHFRQLAVQRKHAGVALFLLR